MINFTSFSDELAKIAEGRYRQATSREQLWLPEGLIGSVIPVDPAEREEAYRNVTKFSAPINSIVGGVGGGMVGFALGGEHGSPIGAAIGTGLGALALGGTSALLRHHMANKIRERAILEETERNRILS